MSMAILKSPPLIPQRMNLQGEVGLPKDAAVAPQPDPRLALEAELTREIEARFEAKLEAAKEEARAEGYKEGLASGHEDGMASALESFKKKQVLLEAVLDKVEGEVQSWLDAVVEQALMVARQALVEFLGESAVDAAALQAVIQRVTAKLRDSDVVAIRLYPTECQTLRSAIRQAGGGTANGAARFLDRLVEDASLQAGGVVVDTPRGEYRATLDVQLRKLMSVLESQREQADRNQAETPSAPVYHARRA